jgi:hypothetical protein
MPESSPPLRVTFSVDPMSRTDITERLADIDGIELVEIRHPGTASLRSVSRMEPFTYFVVALAAHTVAALAHDLIRSAIKSKFGDKNIREIPARMDQGADGGEM